MWPHFKMKAFIRLKIKFPDFSLILIQAGIPNFLDKVQNSRISPWPWNKIISLLVPWIRPHFKSTEKKNNCPGQEVNGGKAALCLTGVNWRTVINWYILVIKVEGFRSRVDQPSISFTCVFFIFEFSKRCQHISGRMFEMTSYPCKYSIIFA